MCVRSLGQVDPLDKGMTTRSRILAWSIPWMEEPGGLQSTGSQRVGHDRVTNTHNASTLLPWFVPLLPLLCPQVCCLYLCLYCCPANRFSCTIFLDSIYMHNIQYLTQ